MRSKLVLGVECSCIIRHLKTKEDAEEFFARVLEYTTLMNFILLGLTDQRQIPLLSLSGFEYFQPPPSHGPGFLSHFSYDVLPIIMERIKSSGCPLVIDV